jgi:hypothetical protein
MGKIFRYIEDMKHKLKKSHWKNGILSIQTFLFETFEAALHFAKRLIGVEIKIYNELDELIHCSTDGDDCETYA